MNDSVINEINCYKNQKSISDSDVFWKDLFLYYFIDNENENEQDDLLFFIFKFDKFKKYLNKSFLKPRIDVMRKFSPNLPIESFSINWEETLYLNLVLQKFTYSVFYSIFTRTSGKDLQMLSKQKIHVYATPSHHSVVMKEPLEQYSYPIVNFNIENFEDFMYENILNDLESIYIELIAYDPAREEQFVLFSSSINHNAINDAYFKKKLISNGQYYGILKIHDSNTDGLAEVVVKKKIKRSTSDGSTFSIIIDIEEAPDSSLDLYFLNWKRNTKSYNVRESNCLTFESQDLFSELNDDLLNNTWSRAGFVQAYFDWKEKQKVASNSFHCFVTNISLPCAAIIEQILSIHRHKSILLH